MTQEEFNSIDWHRGNSVKLLNGKEYLVKKVKKKYLLLWTFEYEKYFIADCRIIDCRTSDFIDDTPKKSKEDEDLANAPSATTAPVPEAAGAAEAPAKKKRKRFTISKPVAERIEIL